MLLDLQEHWQTIFGQATAEEYIDEETFFKSLNKIFAIYEKSSLIPAARVTELAEYCKETIVPFALFFTGRSNCKGLATFVKPGGIDAVWKGLIQFYAKSNESLFMFDEIERQVAKSSLASGATLINLEQEVWFF